MADIEEELMKILRMCGDAQTLFVTDRDGVPVVSVGEELRARQIIIGSYQASADQINKLDIGKHKVSLFTYEQTQLAVIAFTNVTVYICAKPSANAGMMMQLRSEIVKVLSF